MSIVNIVTYHVICRVCNTQPANETMVQIRSEESLLGYSRKTLISKCSDHILNQKCDNCGSQGQFLIASIYCGNRPRQLRFHISRNEQGQMAIFLSDERDVDFLNRDIMVSEVNVSNSNAAFLKRAIKALDNAEVKSESSHSNLDQFLFAIYEEPSTNDANPTYSGEIVLFQSKNFSELLIMRVCQFLLDSHLS